MIDTQGCIPGIPRPGCPACDSHDTPLNTIPQRCHRSGGLPLVAYQWYYHWWYHVRRYSGEGGFERVDHSRIGHCNTLEVKHDETKENTDTSLLLRLLITMLLNGVPRISASLLNPTLSRYVCGAFRLMSTGPFQDKERAEEVKTGCLLRCLLAASSVSCYLTHGLRSDWLG